MSFKYQPGDKVLVEIKNSEVYEGTIVTISTRSLQLNNIFCQTTNTTYEGNLTFYKNEIVKLVSIQESRKIGEENSKANILLDEGEYFRLRDMCFNYVFIDTFGKEFQQAVRTLNDRDSVAVMALGSSNNRASTMSVLLMADFKTVYIFDMFCLVYLKGLQNILESEYICKVVHGGSFLYDNLYHKYKVEMKNIFDTQIVDNTISLEKCNEDVKRSICECLEYHFNFPPSLLSAAMEEISSKGWTERPIAKSNKTKAAQLIVYLLTLKDHLMSIILKKYNDKTRVEYLKIRNLTNLEALKLGK